jgi:hypothetical protein
VVIRASGSLSVGALVPVLQQLAQRGCGGWGQALLIDSTSLPIDLDMYIEREGYETLPDIIPERPIAYLPGDTAFSAVNYSLIDASLATDDRLATKLESAVEIVCDPSVACAEIVELVTRSDRDAGSVYRLHLRADAEALM